MAFKMKGPSLYGSPLTQKKTKGFGPRASEGSDDQSKELARSKYEMGEYKVDPTGQTAKSKDTRDRVDTNDFDDKALDKKEDAEGKGKGSNRTVMKDGYVNPTQKKKLADRKAEYDKKTPAEKKALQDAANDKADKFHKRGKYAVKKKPSQGDFTPAYPGADISKEEYDKRRKAGSTKRD